MTQTKPQVKRGALIGCGFFARNHAHAWRMLAGAEISAICDPQVERCREIAAILGNSPRTYGSAADLLANEELDFVDIATRVDTHEELVGLAAAQALPVICQKPLAPDLASAQRMADALDARGLKNLVHENFRFQPAMRFARERMHEIGQPVFARISFRSGYDVFANQPYLATDSRFICMDVGVHLFDLARYFLGEITDQHQHLQRVNPKIRGEDVATVLTQHGSGATCVIDMSFASHPEHECFPQTLVELEGSAGSIKIAADYRVAITSCGRTEVHDLRPPPLSWHQAPFEALQSSVLALQQHWIDCLSDDRPVEVDFADNVKTLQAVFKCYEGAHA
ncbi:MAG: Gfo/Idh/MocA family oxidoreductase [Propionivibrio sp.]